MPDCNQIAGDIKVPDLSGNTEQQAIEQLQQSQLEHRILYRVVKDSTQQGVVLEQSPAADALTDSHQTVTLVIGCAVVS